MSIFNNTGKHLRGIIGLTSCVDHNVPEGEACYYMPKNVASIDLSDAYYVGVCGSRIRKAGFVGQISPDSMRSQAPRKHPSTKRFSSK